MFQYIKSTSIRTVSEKSRFQSRSLCTKKMLYVQGRGWEEMELTHLETLLSSVVPNFLLILHSFVISQGHYWTVLVNVYF